MAGEIGGKSEASPAYNTQVTSHWPIPTIMQYEVYLKIDRESEIICSYQKFLNKQLLLNFNGVKNKLLLLQKHPRTLQTFSMD